jgi:hypothetical protein
MSFARAFIGVGDGIVDNMAWYGMAWYGSEDVYMVNGE